MDGIRHGVDRFIKFYESLQTNESKIKNEKVQNLLERLDGLIAMAKLIEQTSSLSANGKTVLYY